MSLTFCANIYSEETSNLDTAAGVAGESPTRQNHAKGIKLNPYVAETYYNRGIAYVSKGDLDQAIKDFTKAIELNPNYAEAYINRGLAYAKKGDHDRAIRDLNKATELNPKYTDAYSNRYYGIETDIEVLERILKEQNLSLEEFVVYKNSDEVPKNLSEQPNKWYLIQDDKIIALCITSDKKLTRLDLSGLPELQKLILSYCDIGELNLTNLPKLTELDLEWDENLHQVDLSGLTELRELNLSDCGISDLSLSKLPPKIAKLNLSCNNLHGELKLTDLPKLAVLDLSGSHRLRQVDLSNLPELQELDLSYCDIMNLKLTNLPKLTKLNLGEYFSRNEKLKQVDLSDLPELQELDLRYCGIRDLKLTNLPKLTKLNLSGNENLKQADLSSLTKLQKLNLSNSGMDWSKPIERKNVLSGPVITGPFFYYLKHQFGDGGFGAGASWLGMKYDYAVAKWCILGGSIGHLEYGLGYGDNVDGVGKWEWNGWEYSLYFFVDCSSDYFGSLYIGPIFSWYTGPAIYKYSYYVRDPNDLWPPYGYILMSGTEEIPFQHWVPGWEFIYRWDLGHNFIADLGWKIMFPLSAIALKSSITNETCTFGKHKNEWGGWLGECLGILDAGVWMGIVDIGYKF